MTKKLPPAEQSLWEEFTKGIRPIKHDTVVPLPPRVTKIPDNPYLPVPNISHSQKVSVLHGNDLKNIKLDGQIDLHGFTQASAQMSLREFLKGALYKDWRWVRVITGKGSLGNPSILKEQTPKWLELMPEYVTGYTNAKPDEGGSGAFIVKIRRKVKMR